MLFRRDPEMSITPSAEGSQLFDLGMLMLGVVFYRQSYRIIDSHIATESKQNASDLKSQKLRIKSRYSSLETSEFTSSTPQNLLGQTNRHTAAAGCQIEPALAIVRPFAQCL